MSRFKDAYASVDLEYLAFLLLHVYIDVNLAVYSLNQLHALSGEP